MKNIHVLILITSSLFCTIAAAQSKLPSKESVPGPQANQKISPQGIKSLDAAIKRDKAAGKMQQKGWQLTFISSADDDTALIRKNYQGLIKQSGKPYTLGFGTSRIPLPNTNVATNNKASHVGIKNATAIQTNGNINTTIPASNRLLTEHSITEVNPSKAPGGAEIIISGHKFGNDPAGVEVKINGKSAIVRGISDEQIQVIVPVKAGSGPISVKLNNQTAIALYFTYDWKATVSVFAGRFNNHSNVDGSGGTARFDHPGFLCIDRYDNMYVSGATGIRMINKFGEVSTITGDPSAEIRALFNKPMTSVKDARGNKYELSRYTGTTSTHTTGSTYINKITASGRTTILAGNAPGKVGGSDGYGDAAVFGDLQAIAIDRAGNLYVTEADGMELMNHGDRVRMITPEGRVTTLAGGGTAGIGKRGYVDGKGDLFVADSGNGVIRKITME
jgi:hypothetical protein